MVKKNGRKQQRYPVKINIKIEKLEKSISATAINISANGLGILASESIPPDTNITIHLMIDKEVVMYGSLQWIKNTFAGSIDSYQMGVRTDIIIFKDVILSESSEKEAAVKEILAIIEDSKT